MDHNFTAVLQGWIFYFRMAVGNLLDGICDSTVAIS